MNDKSVKGKNLYGEDISISVEGLYFRPSSYALIVDGSKIALIKSKNGGRYFFPGGGVDLGETMEEALRREVKEETGLEVNQVKLIDCHDVFFEYTPTKETFHSIQFFYFCNVKSTDLAENTNVDDDEAEMPSWVEISSLKKDDFQDPGGDIIERLLNKISK